jgi:N-methylhydantoinase A/oxoprolinase/acetone carboxylase beta subunit
VSARLRSLGLVEELPRQSVTRSKQKRTVAPSHKHTVRLNGKKMSVGVYKREELPAGVALQTPCVVTEYSATTLIPELADAHVDTHGILVINI